jgi:hypothetical protein
MSGEALFPPFPSLLLPPLGPGNPPHPGEKKGRPPLALGARGDFPFLTTPAPPTLEGRMKKEEKKSPFQNFF